jgi:putative peptidoglycan lipid II flippase
VVATFLAYGAMAGPDRSDPAALSSPQKLVLAVGTTLGVVAMTVALWPSLRAIGFRFRWRLDARHVGVRRIARLATWTVVYVIVNQLGYLVVPVLAGGRQGGYTAYAAAFILFQLPHAIFAVSIFTALLPSMSARWTDRDVSGFRDILSQGIRTTGFVVIPAALGYIALSVPIVRLLLQYGESGATDTELIAGILLFFSLGLFSFSMFQLLLRAFYAMQDTRTPALVNVAAVAVNVAANLVFVFPLGLGVRGLALGHATAYTFGAVSLGAILRGRLGRLDGRRIAGSLAKVLVGAGATAGTAWLTYRWLGNALGSAGLGARATQVFVPIALGLLVFAVLTLIFRMEEADPIKRALKVGSRR